MKNPYDVLGISRNATQDEIKRAFRRLAKQYHPDTGGSGASVNRFNEIYDAYSFLMDSNKRSEYDRAANKSSGYAYQNYNGYDEWENRVGQDYARAYINAILEQLSNYKSAASNAIGKGLAWLVGGLIVTGLTYAAASESGGTYVITWGAILFGGIQAIKGIAAYFRINSEIANVERNLWEEFDRQFSKNNKSNTDNEGNNREESTTKKSSSSTSTSYAEHAKDDSDKNSGDGNRWWIIGLSMLGIIVTVMIVFAMSGTDTPVNQNENNNASMDEFNNYIVISDNQRVGLLNDINLKEAANYIDKTYQHEDLDKLAYIFWNFGYEIETYDDLLVSIAHYQSQNNLVTDGKPGPGTMGSMAIGMVDKINGQDILYWVQEDKKIKKVYGWVSEKIDTFVYYVSYGFDYDSNPNNGWRIYCYEVNLEDGDIADIIGNSELENKYRKLGLLE